MSQLDVLDLPQLYTKPSAEALLRTLELLTIAPPSWERNRTDPSDEKHDAGSRVEAPVQVNPEGVTRYLTSIVSSSMKWIEDEDVKEEIWNQASSRLSERSGRSAMGALSRTFRIPTSSDSTDSFHLEIHEPALTGDDLGLKTWAASYLLAKRLHTFGLVPSNTDERIQVLELGSGTGLVGLAMAGLGADVVLTDLPSICPNLARNVQHNEDTVKLGGGSARAAVLDWTHPTSCQAFPYSTTTSGNTYVSDKFPLILAADSLYSADHPRMLVDSIRVWLAMDIRAKVIVEFPYREAYLPEIQDFRRRMTAIGLHILDEGEEKGYDDWGQAKSNPAFEEEGLVTCWWSCWTRLEQYTG